MAKYAKPKNLEDLASKLEKRAEAEWKHGYPTTGDRLTGAVTCLRQAAGYLRGAAELQRMQREHTKC